MTMYVYDADSMVVVAEINGDSNIACESAARDNGYEDDAYGWTYSPAFGFNGGLVDSSDSVEINA